MDAQSDRSYGKEGDSAERKACDNNVHVSGVEASVEVEITHGRRGAVSASVEALEVRAAVHEEWRTSTPRQRTKLRHMHRPY